MKQPSEEVIRILQKASSDSLFATAIVNDPEQSLNSYNLDSSELDYIKSFKSQEELQQEYKKNQRALSEKKDGTSSKKITDFYGLPAALYLLILVIYIVSSQYWPQTVTSFDLPLWATLSVSLKFLLILYGFTAAGILAISTRRLIRGLEPTARVTTLIGVVIFGFIPGSILLGIMPSNVRFIMIRVLLTLIFTILPASLYSLFISTRGKTLWEEFVVNVTRLDPVGSEQLLPVYRKKFNALYGSPDQSDFGSALLQGEASFPVLFATFLVGLGWILFFSAVGSDQKADALSGVSVSPFTFGFLGAYLFSLQMLFRRYVQTDLKSVAYTHMSQRILLTWVWTFVLSVLPLTTFSNADNRTVIVSVLAFTVGVFPDIAWQVIAQFLQRVLSIGLPSFREQYPLNEIDGVTIWVEARLLEEDVENVENLITAGIVDLMLRTNLKPERIVHWIDQGVLRLHLGTEKNTPLKQSLRDHGIITATDLVFAYKAHDAYINRTAQEGTSKVFLNEQLDPLIRNLVVAVEDDPNMYHVFAWRELNAIRRIRLPGAVRTQIRRETQPQSSAESWVPPLISAPDITSVPKVVLSQPAAQTDAGDMPLSKSGPEVQPLPSIRAEN